ncbi:MAG: murein biosynthesis integral membrane protein MurJ [Parcubacteria group bacterium]
MIKKILKLNDHISGSVISAAFLITITGLVSRVLGLFRDRLLASTFGAGDTLDVYYAAFRVPDLIYNLLIVGALSSAFIPVFAALLSNDKEEEAWEMARGIMNLALCFIVILSVIFAIFTPFIMKALTPGFSPDKLAQVVVFTRVMFLSPLLLGISGILGGILTSYKRFLTYSLAPIFYNVGIIFGILVLVKIMGPIGLAWSVVLGGFLHLVSQYLFVGQLGFKHNWSLFSSFSNRSVRKVFTLMIPRAMGIAVNQINLFVITIFASLLASGSLAVFNFAQNLQSVPLGLVGISFAMAVFPTLSSLYAKKKDEEFIAAFSETFRQIIFFVIPISVLMLLLRAQIVRVILGAGKFDWEDTILTFQCLGIFSLSLFAQSVTPLLARAFYAMHNTKTPFYIALISEAVNILAVVLLIGRYQILSLAIAFSLAALVQMFLLLFALRMEFDNLDDQKIISSVTKVVLATFFAGLAVQLSKYMLAGMVDLERFIGVFSQLAVSVLAGGAIFLAICHFMELEEYVCLKKSLNRRLFGKKQLILEEDAGEISGI